MVSAVRIAVVGVGPRGLAVVERVVSHARLDGPPIDLLLIEPGQIGLGVHQVKQPDYLLLNTIAGQLTIFSDETMTPGAPVTSGPGFLDWCRQRRTGAGYAEFLPRRLLGEYLQWAAGELLDRLPARLSVRHVSAVATAVREEGDGAEVILADGSGHRVDLAVVTTGHGLAGTAPEPADETVIETPYPLPEQVGRISPGAGVALLGTGLTGMDVIAALTVGRGGRFTEQGYRASGREPRIVLANRSGWLPCARPATSAARRGAPAGFLTAEAVAALREGGTDGGRLDFRARIEPLIRREALARMGSATAEQIAAVERVLDPPAEERLPGYPEYAARLAELARFDLREAERGLGVSPVKDALEVLRDHRDGLRAALDPPGLTERSHRYFMAEYVPLVNRAVIGPQKERIRELLLLIEAGIVAPGPGPRPELTRDAAGWVLSSTRLDRPHRIPVDVVVRANLAWPLVDPKADPVGDSLRGWAAAGPAAGLRLDRDGFVVPRDGGAGRHVAVLGPPAEGASYYNHYVASPGVWSRALTDVDRVIGPLLGTDPISPTTKG